MDSSGSAIKIVSAALGMALASEIRGKKNINHIYLYLWIYDGRNGF